jgi:hypothetical protein
MQKPTEKLDSLGADELKDIQKTLTELVHHIVQRIEYAESRRSTIATLGGALLASAFALIPFATQVFFFPVKAALLATAVVWLLYGAIIWFVYARQTNFHYPFTDVASTPKWFYRDALKNNLAFDAPWHTFQSKEEQDKGKNAFNEQWKVFKKEQIGILASPKDNLLQDLQQVYLLHVNERYKNLFLTQLRNLLSQGLIMGLILGLVAFTGSILFFKQDPVKTQNLILKGDLEIRAFWRVTGKTRTIVNGVVEKELLINIAIVNNSNIDTYTYSEDKLLILDKYGLKMPFEISAMKPLPLAIQPKSRIKVSALIWVSESLVNDIEHMEF